ncbi:MAG: aspartyl protease family protein [Prevotella sp.]|nr:aspartyl protease family protein [Prevotella sp.]
MSVRGAASAAAILGAAPSVSVRGGFPASAAAILGAAPSVSVRGGFPASAASVGASRPLPYSRNGAPARYSRKLALSAKNFADTIEIEWERGQVYVPVEMGGRHYRFLFDTGAAQSVVYADTPIEGSKAAGYIRSHDAVGTVNQVPMVILPPMTLGHITIRGCQATVQQRPVQQRPVQQRPVQQRPKGWQADGILGFNIINSGLLAKIDVRQRLLILTDRKKFFNHEQGFDTRYMLKFFVPYLEASPFGNYREPVLFDTGSRRLYAMNRQSFDACAAMAGSAIDSQVEGRSMGRHAIGHFGVEPLSEVVFLHLSRFRVCSVDFCNLHTLTTQGESHVGAAILEYGAMIINPRKKRMRFQPFANIPVSVDNEQLDIAFVADHGMPCVGLVWEQGEPYRRGFRQGDIIVAIDGNEVSSFSQFVAWPFIIGHEHRFTVRGSDGRLHDIHWIRL